MNSKEIVRSTLDYGDPERVARSFPPSDMADAEIQIPEGEWHRVDSRRWERVDAWGNTWARVDDTSKGEVARGALQNLDDVDTFPLPDFDNPSYYAHARQVFDDNPDKWAIGHIHGFTFSMARKLRRLDQYFIDLMLEREKIRILHDRIDALIKVQMQRMYEAGADCIMVAEDWGTQLQLLISPALWREEFKPRLADLFACARDLNLRVFFHSCGKLTAVVPDLIEIGVDVMQFDQPTLHGLDTLAAMQARGKVTFWCPVDIQKTLPTQDEATIRQAARDLLDTLWRGHGGFIAGYYSDQASLGLDPKWQSMACDEFRQRGRRALYTPVETR